MTSGLSIAARHRQGAFQLRAAFTAPPGITALFGRSGSGKTTLVNVIAGLVRPDSGRVAVGDDILLDTALGIDLPRHKRRVGYVFQDARLFPHLGVRQNLVFGRWFAGRDVSGPSLDEVVDLLGLGGLLGRRPAGLSGGERQRVAIGRALLAGPRLLLMDEPLASLDEARKAEILPFIERLRDASGVPIVYVSHALPEVIRLADTVVLLDGGLVVAAGPATDVLSRPDAGGVGAERDVGTLLEAVIDRHDAAYGLTALSTAIGPLMTPRLDLLPGMRRRVRVQARDVMLSRARPEGLSALNVFPAVVLGVDAEVGDSASRLVRLTCGDGTLLARITRRSVDVLGIAPGLPVFAIVKSVALP